MSDAERPDAPAENHGGGGRNDDDGDGDGDAEELVVLRLPRELRGLVRGSFSRASRAAFDTSTSTSTSAAVHDGRRTLAARLLGVERASAIARFISGTLLRMTIWISCFAPVVVPLVLGTFKIVPEGVYIASLVLFMFIVGLTHSVSCDMVIVSHLVPRFRFVVNILISGVASCALLVILQFDYRGAGSVVVWLTTSAAIQLIDAYPSDLALGAVLPTATALLSFAVYGAVVPLGLLPDMLPNPVIIYSWPVFGTTASMEAYSLFNGSQFALILLALNDMYHRFKSRDRPSLQGIVLHLDLVDEFELADFSYMERFRRRRKLTTRNNAAAVVTAV